MVAAWACWFFCRNGRTTMAFDLKYLNRSGPVRNKLKHINCEIATLEQMMTLLSRVDGEYARALIESHFPSHRLSQYS